MATSFGALADYDHVALRALLSATMNPAKISTIVAGLFAPGAVATEMRESCESTLLLPAEAAYLGRAVPKRVREFTAGRLCARRALSEFGITDFPIEVADDRRPRWPASMVGSITHTRGYCAAVVAERRCRAAVGLDSEVVGDVTEEIWNSVCVAAEIDWLNSLPASERIAAVSLIFCAKEAFYKCQYTLVYERLNFHDVKIEAQCWGDAAGEFCVQAMQHIALGARAVMPLKGRYRFHEEFVSTGMELTAGREYPAGP